jgi:hypothetical protein
MTNNQCELCNCIAVATDSIPDASLPGVHPGECGYKTIYLCYAHAIEREEVKTARVQWFPIIKEYD